MPSTASAYAAFAANTPLAPHSLTRRDPGPDDVAIAIKFCGVCHSDVHFLRGEWGPILYPAVAGHEIIGTVTAVGSNVSNHKVGDTVGVGCLVDSCRNCSSCRESLENYCTDGLVGTYGMGVDKYTGGPTYGGYSSAIVVDKDFVLRIPGNLDLAATAPLLCAGVTTWSPLRHWNIGSNSTVAVVGLGGLGHMAVKLATAMGAEVVVFTTSPGKVADAKALGAHDVVISSSADEMARQSGRFDFILDSVSASHSLDQYLGALKRDGTICLLGIPSTPHPSPSVMPLVLHRKSITGSMIGSIKETQEMLDFCGEHDITAEIEKIPMERINDAHERMLRNDVKYRFVIEM